MTDLQAVVPSGALSRAPARTAAAGWLRAAVTAWVGVALAGQAVFAAYVAIFYGGAALSGTPERWNDVLPRGWVGGDTPGNAALVAHLLFAPAVVLAGALQLWPGLRRRWPGLHRASGRVYLVGAGVLALGGLWLVWVRGGAAGDTAQHLAITVNALLIVACAVMAWRAARRRRFDVHRRWALRLFVAASGVWLFRVGLMAWLGAWRAPVGFSPETFSGPFLTLLAWGVYAGPTLLVLEGVLRTERGTRPLATGAMAALMAVLTLVTAFGVAMATLGMWGPRMR